MLRRPPLRPHPIGVALVTVLVAMLVTAAAWLVVARGGHHPLQGSGERGGLALGGEEEGVDAALTRAIEAADELPHGGLLTVVSFAAAGPRISELRVTRDADAIHLARAGEQRDGDGWEIGWTDGEAFLRSSDELLRLGGVEAPPAQLDRLRVKYRARLGDEVVLDTGPARVLHLVERSVGILRENLYLDEETGLIVRRESFGADGDPVRLVAYTQLHVDPVAVEAPTADGVDTQDHTFAARADADRLAADGHSIPRELPGGFELIAAAEVDAATPAVHLLYGDGLYSLSLFQQDGRLARTAVHGATELATTNGGAVWRWPGSEPRRVVWTGEGRTFTVLTDAPTDELLDAIAGLPVDPSPSILDRLQRGISRAGHWLSFGEGSEP